MGGGDITPAVRELIATAVDSVGELEAILLLRQHRDRAWTPAEAGQRLYVSETVAAHILTVLEHRGFLMEESGGFRYAPRVPETDQAVAELAAAYARHLVEVTRLVHAKPARGVLDFADAFRFRKEN